MNGRRLTWITLVAVGTLALLAAMSASADPADLDNPPTHDWFFDSGLTVIISGKTWDINYNITVANDTHLVFDNCTFTFYDPYGLNYLWVWVMWNGSMDLVNCDFSSKDAAEYFVYLENGTLFDRVTMSGMVVGPTMAGIYAYWCDLEFRHTTISDIEGSAVWAENCNIKGNYLTVTGSGSDGTDEASFMAVYGYNSYDEMFMLRFDDSEFKDNDGRGFGLRAYSNWADISAEFYNCHFDRNERRGLDIYWGRDGYSENTNASLEVLASGCVFDGNHWDGFRYQQNDVRRNGDAFVNVTLDDCDFMNGEGSGAFMNVRYADQTFNIVVNECDFTDNAIGGRAGLALSNQYIYSVWNARITDCTFSGNDFYGFHIEHRSSTVEGSSYLIKDCTFSDQDQSLYIYNRRHGDYFGDIRIEGCHFSDSKEAGIHQYIEWSPLPITVQVHDCTFFNSDGAGISSDAYYDETDGVWWDISDCTFMNLGGRAIKFNLDYVDTGATLEITNCSADNTAGIEFMVMDSIDVSQATHVLKMTETSVTNSTGAAIEAAIYGYYGVGLNAEFETVHVADALFNGLRVIASTNFATKTSSIDMDIQLKDVTIVNVEGNGLNLGTDRVDYPGTRSIEVHGLDVVSTIKAVTLSSLKGEFYDTTITKSENQDLTAITTDVEMFEPDLDRLDSTNVQVIESGSVKFWYRLKLYVKWDTGLAVEGAVVEIMDNQHTIIGIYTQADETGVPELFLNSYQFRESGLFTRSPYILNVTFKAIQKTETVDLKINRQVTITLADHVPPSLFINEPVAGHRQASTSIDVRGSSFDTESGVETVEVSIDGMTWVPMTDVTSWTHTFTVTDSEVEDNGGVFTIRARANDFAGNPVSTLRQVEVDPFPPELRVDYPTDFLSVNTPTISVRGVTEVGATVVVNGVSTPVLGTLFMMEVDLVEGPNTITVSAFDDLGNVKTEKLEVVLDTKPPYVVLLDPKEGLMFTEPSIEVSGQAEDGLVLTVNGELLGEEDYHDGAFSYEISLERGGNTISVEATDMAGNHILIERSVILDDVVPILAIQSPLDMTYQNFHEIIVIGTTDQDATVLINDEAITLEKTRFTHTIIGIDGKPNVITVTAQDEAGNTATIEITVYIDTSSPVVDITSPPVGGEMVTSNRYTIAGTTSNDAVKVTINGVDHMLDSPEFSVEVDLLEGENRFIIDVTDRAGNTVTRERVVVLDTIAPTLVVRIPNLQDADGKSIYKTKKGEAALMRINGYTDDAVQVRINGELVPIASDGYFVLDWPLNVNSINNLEVIATDAAGNSQTWNHTVYHEHIDEEVEGTFDWGYVVLVLGLILLLIAIVAGWMRLSKGEPTAEPMEVEEEEVLAPAAMPEVEEEEELEEEEEEEELEEEDEDIVIEEEEIHELTAPSERPKTDTSRPAAAPAEEEEEKRLEMSEKELDEKEGDVDLEADETDQEGI